MMKADRTELSLIGVAIAVAIAAQFSPNWLVFTLTLAISTGLVVMGVVMLIRAGLVSFGQGLFYCLGGYAVGLGGRFLGITDALVLIGLGVIVVVIAAAMLVPWVRAWAMKRVMPTVRQTWPRLTQVLGQPWRLGLGLAGNLLLTVGFVGAFHAALSAFGQELPIIDVAVKGAWKIQ